MTDQLKQPVTPVMPGSAENKRYQALEEKHDELVTQLKTLLADGQVSEKDKRDFIELQVMPVEDEMRELVVANRSIGGVLNRKGQQVKFTKEIKVKGLTGNLVQLNYFKNTQLKKRREEVQQGGGDGQVATGDLLRQQREEAVRGQPGPLP